MKVSSFQLILLHTLLSNALATFETHWGQEPHSGFTHIITFLEGTSGLCENVIASNVLGANAFIILPASDGLRQCKFIHINETGNVNFMMGYDTTIFTPRAEECAFQACSTASWCCGMSQCVAASPFGGRTCQYGDNLLNIKFESTQSSESKRKGIQDCSKCSEGNKFFTFQSDGTCKEMTEIVTAFEVLYSTSGKCQPAT